jgi:hypothetical protein
MRGCIQDYLTFLVKRKDKKNNVPTSFLSINSTLNHQIHEFLIFNKTYYFFFFGIKANLSR